MRYIVGSVVVELQITRSGVTLDLRTYTAYKKFMNGFAWLGFDLYGAIISTGRCQTTIACKSAK